MTTDRHQYQIIGGPSREELFDALRLRHEGRTVPFTIRRQVQRADVLNGKKVLVWKKTIEVKVDSIGIEDGSGNNWLLSLVDVMEHGNLEAYYNTKRREGWVRSETFLLAS